MKKFKKQILAAFLLAFASVGCAQSKYYYTDWIVKREKPTVAERIIYRINQVKEPAHKDSSRLVLDTLTDKDGKMISVDTSLVDLVTVDGYQEPDTLSLVEIYNAKGLVAQKKYQRDGSWELLQYDEKDRLKRTTVFRADSSVYAYEYYTYDDSLRQVTFKELRGTSLVFEDTYMYDSQGRWIGKIFKDYGAERYGRISLSYSAKGKKALAHTWYNSEIKYTTEITLENGKTSRVVKYDSAMKKISSVKEKFKGDDLVFSISEDEKGVVYNRDERSYDQGLLRSALEYDEKGLRYKYVFVYKLR